MTVKEGDLLMVECTTNNIPDISTFEIRDRNGALVNAPLGVYNVPSVTREYAGTYFCIIMSTIDNSTVNETSEVIIQCKLSLLGYTILPDVKVWIIAFGFNLISKSSPQLKY